MERTTNEDKQKNKIGRIEEKERRVEEIAKLKYAKEERRKKGDNIVIRGVNWTERLEQEVSEYIKYERGSRNEEGKI